MMGWILLSIACIVAGYRLGWSDAANALRGRRTGPRL